eukprot:TRINITY_DN2890_c0_g1_i1.p1 TRINITY_DN2890_c0_g1~~TRINITY_DN2890_c0_g1_i1.p1  ORF type:complete len:289 (-),score=89.31 TRINITY_DN2890_c0_g1_i1:36-902(-)
MNEALEEFNSADFPDYFYENHVPECDELVTVRVMSIDQMGVMCHLLEYNNVEGFLPLSEISRKRMRSVLRHVRVGQKQVLQVLRVDNERGFTDLSKKYITGVERAEGFEKYNQGKTVHSMAKRIAITQNKELEEVKKVLVYPLYNNKFTHPYHAFKEYAASGEDIYEDVEMDEEWAAIKDILLELVQKRMEVQPVKVGAEVNVTCYGEDGIDAIINALNEGLNAVDENEELTIQLVSSPTYLIWTTATDVEKGEVLINKVIDKVKEVITENDGELAIQEEATVLGKID